MPLNFIASNSAGGPAQKNIVFNDSAMPIEYAVAKREQDLKGKAFVFQVPDQKSIYAMIAALAEIRADGKIANSDLLKSRAVQSLVKKGLVAIDGSAAGFQNDLKAKPNPPIEILCDTVDKHYAVFSMNEDGLAYIDPKGDPCPNKPFDPSKPDVTLQKVLLGEWVRFYGKDEKDESLVSKVHFHEGIKQQEKDHENVDWCLANLEKLSASIHADSNTLKAVRRADRKALVNAINGQPDPQNLKQKLALTYRDESRNETQKQERQEQLKAVQKHANKVHQGAVQLWRGSSSDALRQDPQYSWVEVCIATPPEYHADDDINKFNTTRNNGMKNEFGLDEKNNISAKSVGGDVSYEERFTRLAADLAPILQENGGSMKPIVIDGVKPPGKEALCKEAFEKVFGKGNVTIRQEDKVDPNEIVAEPIQFSS